MTNHSIAGKRSFRTILCTVLALVLIISTFASTALAETVEEYKVTVVDNAERFAITTTETEPIDILEKAGFSLSANDTMDISGFKEGKGGRIIVTRQNEINIDFDGNITNYTVYAGTVGQALDELGITVGEGEVISHNDDEKIKNGMVISIKSPFSVTLKVDDESTKYAVVDGTVADLLDHADVKLGEDDYTEPGLDTELKKGLKVVVNRVTYKTVKKTKEVDYKTISVDDKTLLKGTTKVIKEGKKGSTQITYEIKYVNGEKVDKTVKSRKVIEEPVNKKVAVGTKKPKKVTTTAATTGASNSGSVKGNGVKEVNGIRVGQHIDGVYTHYCACATCNGSSNGITSSGKRIQNGMANPYYIACNWLPLGSVLQVDGVNYTVVDRGGSSLSAIGRIDIFTPEGHAACYRYGTGGCSIKVVRLGW